MSFLGGLFNAVAGPLVGGLFGKKNQQNAQDHSLQVSREERDFQVRNQQLQRDWALADRDHENALATRWRAEDKATAEAASLREYERQKEFARMGLTWKMQDAASAGIHPIAALGGGSSLYSPAVALSGGQAPASARGVSGIPSSGGSYIPDGSNPMGTAFAQMGQNLTRAFMATKSEEEREMEMLTMQGARLRNQLTEAQIANTWASTMGQPSNPGFPGGVSGAVGANQSAVTGAVRVEPSRVVSHAPGDRGREAGSTPLTKRYNMPGGGFVDLLSEKAAEAVEGLGPGAGPMLLTIGGLRRWWHGPDQVPKGDLPSGWSWEWSPLRGAWSPQPPQAAPLEGFRKWSGGRGNARLR